MYHQIRWVFELLYSKSMKWNCHWTSCTVIRFELWRRSRKLASILRKLKPSLAGKCTSLLILCNAMSFRICGRSDWTELDWNFEMFEWFEAVRVRECICYVTFLCRKHRVELCWFVIVHFCLVNFDIYPKYGWINIFVQIIRSTLKKSDLNQFACSLSHFCLGLLSRLKVNRTESNKIEPNKKSN